MPTTTPPPNLPLTIPTPYGPATFVVSFTASGAVREVTYPQFDAPSSLWKLTYGEAAEEARAYLREELAVIPYRVVANQFGGSTKAFAEVRARPQVRGVGEEAAVQAWAVRVAELPRDQQQLLGDALSYAEKPARGAIRELGRHEVDLLIEPALVYPKAPSPQLVALYYYLARFTDPRIAELVLTELERPGRSPNTRLLLRNVSNYHSPGVLDRLLAVYARQSHGALTELLPDFAAVLKAYRDPRLVELAHGAVLDFPTQAPAIQQLLERQDVEPGTLGRWLREGFDTADHYETIHDFLGALLDLGEDAPIPTLPEVNERLAQPPAVNAPQVEWWQKLESSVGRVLDRSFDRVAFASIVEAMNSPVPRMQRNGLLELDYVNEHPELREWWSEEAEAALRERIGSRYDKVTTTAITLSRRMAPLLHAPEEMLYALLAMLETTKYRILLFRAISGLTHARQLHGVLDDYYAVNWDRIKVRTAYRQHARLLAFLGRERLPRAAGLYGG